MLLERRNPLGATIGPEAERELQARVTPYFRNAVLRCETAALHRLGWFIKAIDAQGNGYHVCGRPELTAIRWSLMNAKTVQVTMLPERLILTPLAGFDLEMAERLIAVWWDVVKPR